MPHLAALILQGENNAVEFKSAAVTADSIAKEIVAFANTLVRVGTTNRTASPQELLRLFQQAGIFHFDRTPVRADRVG